MPQGRIICNDSCRDYHCRDHQEAQPNLVDIIKRCHSQQTDKNDGVEYPVNDKPDKTGNHGLAGVGGRNYSKKPDHENRSGAPGDLVVEIRNDSNWPTRVQVVQSTAKPCGDPMWAGHVAAVTFLRRQREDAGYLVDLQPGQVLRPVIQTLPQGQCASGIAEYRVVSGSDVTLRVRLAPCGSSLPLALAQESVPPVQAPAWVFPEAERKIEARYTVGQRWAFISIGRTPAVGLVPEQRLLGNYGMVYDIRLTAENPDQQDADLEVLLTAPSGVARGVFYIDGNEVESPLIRPGEDASLFRTLLPAGRSRTFRITTIPESGSFYPVVLVARAVKRAPAPPPPTPEPEPAPTPTPPVAQVPPPG
jgi:hypothetical protein